MDMDEYGWMSFELLHRIAIVMLNIVCWWKNFFITIILNCLLPYAYLFEHFAPTSIKNSGKLYTVSVRLSVRLSVVTPIFNLFPPPLYFPRLTFARSLEVYLCVDEASIKKIT
jgi:hypothetical protein